MFGLVTITELIIPHLHCLSAIVLGWVTHYDFISFLHSFFFLIETEVHGFMLNRICDTHLSLGCTWLSFPFLLSCFLFECGCAPMSVCRCTCVCTGWVCLCVHACRGQRTASHSHDIPQVSFTFYFILMQGLSMLGTLEIPRLTDQQAPMNPALFSSPEPGLQRAIMADCVCPHGFWGLNSCPYICN